MADGSEINTGGTYDKLFTGLTVANTAGIVALAYYTITRTRALEERVRELEHENKEHKRKHEALGKRVGDAKAAKERLTEAEERIEELEKFMENLGDVNELGELTVNMQNVFTALEENDIECQKGNKCKKKNKSKNAKKVIAPKSKQRKDVDEEEGDDEEEDIYSILDESDKPKSKKPKRR